MRLVTVLWHRLHPPARESSAMWPSVRDRLIRIPSKRKYCLAAASGFVSLIVVAGLAFHVVGSVRRQSDATDRMHAVLIELSAIGANAENMERLERDVSVNRVAMAAAFAEGNENMARSIGALESLIPEDSARRALLRDMSKLVARQRISLLKQQPSEITDGSAEPWLSLGDDIEVLAHQMWQAEKRELDVSKAAEHEGFAHIRNWVVAIAIAACLPGALLLLLLRHDVVTQRRAAALLARVNSRLDLKVKERTAELAAANERLHELSARIQAAREEERLHIAREVHDELGSTLTALKLELSGSAKQLDASGNHRLRHRRASADLVDMALQTVQNVVTALRPSVLDKFGLWEAIAWKAEQFEAERGPRARSRCCPVCRNYRAKWRSVSTACWRKR